MSSKGAIHWTRTQGEARAELVEQWAKDSAAAPEKSRFVFAYTNADVAAAQRGAARGAQGSAASWARITSFETRARPARLRRRRPHPVHRTDKKAGIFNGAAGTIEAIDGSRI